MFRITLRTLIVGQLALWPLLFAAAADSPPGELSSDGKRATLAEVTSSGQDTQSEAPSPSRTSDIDTPTHRQVRQIVPTCDGELIKVNTFCMSPDGHILAACNERSGARAIRGLGDSKAKSRGCLVVFDGDGKQQDVYDLRFRPTAIKLAPDGSLFVAGEGTLAHLTAQGELIREAAAPNVGEEDEFREKALAAAKKQAERDAQMYKQQIEIIQNRIDQIDQLEEKPADELTKLDEARLAAYKKNLEVFQNAQTERSAVDLDERLRQAMTITAIGVTDRDVFVSCRSVEGHGYTVWRTDHSFENAQPVVDNVRGCCGQMDLQCFGDKLLIAENTSFKVGIYDRDGESIGGFGKRDRSSKTGFGSCCNPMNVRPLSDGSVLTAESSIGHIKRFDVEGNLISYIGKAKVAGGCKHCCVGYDANSDQFYMMHEDANVICVLANRDKLPELSEEDHKVAAIREQFDARLLGTWELGARSQQRSPIRNLVSGLFGGRSSSSLPFEKITLHSDGTLAVKGGQYAQFGQHWTWIPTSHRDDTVHLSLSADQVELLKVEFELSGDNAAQISCSFYGQKMGGVPAVRTMDCNGKPCGEACEEEQASPPSDTAAAEGTTGFAESAAIDARTNE